MKHLKFENTMWFITFKNKFIASGISQNELSDAIGTTKQSVCNWLSGKNYPNNHFFVKISDYFNIDVRLINDILEEIE